MTLAACTGRETRALLDDVATFISERPDSALAVLKSIDSDDLGGRCADARYALLYSMALDKNVIDETNDSLVSIATEWYSRHGSADDRLKAFYYHGRVRQNAGDNEGAMEQFVIAETYAEAASDEYAKGLLYNAMGNTYMDIYETESAYKAYVKSQVCYRNTDNIDRYAGALLNIARYELERQDYDEAGKALIEVFHLSDQITDSRKSIYYCQLINLYIGIGNIDGLREALREYKLETDVALIDWLKISEAYCFLKDYKLALASLDRYRDYDVNYESNLAYLICAYELYYSLGWIDQALEAYKKYTSMLNVTTIDVLNQDTRFVKERYESEIKVMKEQNTTLLVLLCASLSAMLLLFVISNVKKRLKIEQEAKRRYMEECSFLESERNSLEELIQSNCLVDKKAQDVINSRLDLLNRFFTSAIQDNSKKDMEVSQEFDFLIDNKEKFLRDTRMVFAGMYPRFISYLDAKGLLESQIEICCLYALGLKGKDVINYTNRKRQYIDNMDIRAKLGLTEHDRNLDKFIQALLMQYK